MRRDILVLGIVLLILGIIISSLYISETGEYQTDSGQFVRVVDETGQARYNFIIEGIGIFMSIIGLILTIVGAATTKK